MTIGSGRSRLQSAATFAIISLALCAGGCADLNFRRVKLGQTAEQYERILPSGKTRRTEAGLSYLESDMAGRTDAIIILLARDRRVCGRIHATRYERNYGFKTESGYRLVGEIDPALADLKATGPVDSLRVVTADLLNFRGEKLAMDAQRWTAAGLVRLIQRWPNAGQPMVDPPELADFLQKVPGGGRSQIAADQSGIYQFEYVQGVTR